VSDKQDGRFVEPSTGMAFVRVPGGKFVMGSNFWQTQAPADQQWFRDESPPHMVTLSRDFWLAETAVTVGTFRQFVEETAHVSAAEQAGQSLGRYEVVVDAHGRSVGQWATGTGLSWRDPGHAIDDRHPVTHVSAADADAFVHWLAIKSGKPYRLPTEAEWEYAAGGAAHTEYSWGEGPPTLSVANIADARFIAAYPEWKYPVLAEHDDGHAQTAPVGSYPPNSFSLFDMTGNVWEWVADHYDPDAYSSGAAVDPTGPAGGSERVHRGGGFDWELPYLRVQKRRRAAITLTAVNIGFRVAL
jgi:formylglycine-generating enzyme required for sulfatase activity